MAATVFDRKAKDAAAYATDAPWVEKFRPKSLDEVAAHKEIIETSEASAMFLFTDDWSAGILTCDCCYSQKACQ